MENIIKKLVGDKKQYRAFKKAEHELPEPYRSTLEALEKYMWNFAKGSGFMAVLEELLDIFQESAQQGIPVANIVGADPVAFCDEIMAQYPDDLWLITYQNKLRQNIKEILDK